MLRSTSGQLRLASRSLSVHQLGPARCLDQSIALSSRHDVARTRRSLHQSLAVRATRQHATLPLIAASQRFGSRRGYEHQRTQGDLPLYAVLALQPLFLTSIDCDSLEEPKMERSAEKKATNEPEDIVVLIHEESHHSNGVFHTIFLFFDKYLFEPISTTRRFLYLGLLFLPVILSAPILLLEWTDLGRGKALTRSGRRRAANRQAKGMTERSTTIWWYGLLVHQMERAGPTFIKLAQWAGSRRDLFPDTLCALFGRLHSGGKPHALSHTKKALEHAFQRPFAEIFSEFDENPMGIGAVGQAYKGTLNTDLLPAHYLGPKHQDVDGPTQKLKRAIAPATEDSKPPAVPTTSVAIKVLHPGVRKMINRDLKIMSVLANMLNAVPGMEWLSFPEEVEVFGGMMRAQLDLRTEAQNLQTFEHNFRHRKTVSFPRPLTDYTSQSVLVEEYEDAVPLKMFLREGGGPYDEKIANLGLDAFLNMLLIDNFVHSDLHPGNIFVKFYPRSTKGFLQSIWASLFDKEEPDPASAAGSESLDIAHRLRKLSHDHEQWAAELDKLNDQGYEPELVFIDTGLVTELNDVNRRNFIDLFRAVAEFDGHKAGVLMVERCRAPDLVVDEDTFALKMQHLILSVKSQTFSLAKIKISDVLSQVLTNIREHHVKLEADFVNTVISILLLEGIGRQLNPEMDLFKSALPILRSLGGQMDKGDVLRGGVRASDIVPMLKIWGWIEIREMASIAISEVDDLLRYDNLMPNI
ncbi:uncharacterized protein L969DRAFT_83918 [Mixia osmundae IAM 14324]|uniref:ABC1 atypical kinase-like domain-containing protein n=1 Tax=Mixia osmundae (strain CBS 9802 / IAM 14324 / JCM 22182 / KY 12970) TaxID=764103 RepID=G7DVB1_MIXOS|nr:uncharacterized protein L969DRAFT_83918 [Mixia osmundae IAM 14324]KEI42056.1 hypothetical protein L969DRAFT_83918 [Mixia osmundae IAM 14324]GAA94521.1 hypothetical protein E5Q_01173 [Mixia osmundae IAM 14324]